MDNVGRISRLTIDSSNNRIFGTTTNDGARIRRVCNIYGNAVLLLKSVIYQRDDCLVLMNCSRAVTAFLFISRAFISGAFQCAYVYTPEVSDVAIVRNSVTSQVYPTTLRAIGLGAASGMARFGAIITPFVAQVVDAPNLMCRIFNVPGCIRLVDECTNCNLCNRRYMWCNIVVVSTN